jgi:hypothetical protein
VLATCNRVEVYADTEAFHAGVDAVSDLLSRLSGVPLDELKRSLYVHWEAQAVLHLFQVACGLDSMVIGESQILGQLRRAYATARDGGAGPTLHELFQKALKVGKRAHSETGIDQAGRSLVTVGLEGAVAAVGPLAGRTRWSSAPGRWARSPVRRCCAPAPARSSSPTARPSGPSGWPRRWTGAGSAWTGSRPRSSRPTSSSARRGRRASSSRSSWSHGRSSGGAGGRWRSSTSRCPATSTRRCGRCRA